MMKQRYNAMMKPLEHYLITHLPHGIALVLLSFLDIFCVIVVLAVGIAASVGFLVGVISLFVWGGCLLGIGNNHPTLKNFMSPTPSALAVAALFVLLTTGVLASYADMNKKIPQREKNK